MRTGTAFGIAGVGDAATGFAVRARVAWGIAADVDAYTLLAALAVRAGGIARRVGVGDAGSVDTRLTWVARRIARWRIEGSLIAPTPAAAG